MDADNKGYRRLADFMAWEPSLAIFPRFRSASMLCLLHLQAQITELEDQLKDLAYADNTSGEKTRRELAFDWSVMKTLGKGSPQYKLHADLRALLAEYIQYTVVGISLCCFTHQ